MAEECWEQKAASPAGETRGGLRSRETPRGADDALELMFSSAHVAIAYIDPSFNFIRVNRAYAAADGRDPDFFVGRNHFDLYPDKENEAIFRKVAASGEPFFTHEKPFIYPERPERGTTWWEWSLVPVLKDGAVSGLVFSLREVTAQVRARQALEESERKYRACIEQAEDAIMVLDADGRIVEANPRAGEMTGYALPELTALRIEDVVPEETFRKRPLRAPRTVAGKPLSRERPLRRKDGSMLSTEGVGKKLPDGRFVVTLRDVTQRKRAEEAAVLYQQRLRILTSRLAIAEEEERRRIAKDIHDQVGQTLALCQIKLGALVEDSPDDALAASLKEIRSYIAWIIKYTRSLTFELGSPILYELGLEAALDEFVSGMRDRYGISGAFEDDGRSKPLSADMRVILFQAVREVLTNTIKHARAANVKVSVAAEDPGVVIRVADDGVGFDTAEVESRIQRNGGFGIFSTRERLDYVGGSLDIRSSRGCGTLVTIRAPLMKE